MRAIGGPDRSPCYKPSSMQAPIARASAGWWSGLRHGYSGFMSKVRRGATSGPRCGAVRGGCRRRWLGMRMEGGGVTLIEMCDDKTRPRPVLVLRQ